MADTHPHGGMASQNSFQDTAADVEGTESQATDAVGLEFLAMMDSQQSQGQDELMGAFGGAVEGPHGAAPGVCSCGIILT